MSIKKITPLGQVSDYELRLLKVFKAVVECGGFTAAETELNIHRSTISTHISRLEDRLNLKLCRRGRAGFALTDDGRTIYEATLLLFSRLDEFQDTVKQVHQQLSGELKIISSDTIWLEEDYSFVDLLAQFYQQAPEVNISIDIAYMGEIERQVLSDETDLGFIHYHRTLEGLNYINLYQSRNYLYCSNLHPLYHENCQKKVQEKLKEFKFIHPGIYLNSQTTQQIQEMTLAGKAYHYEPRLALILSGMYIGFLPESYAKSWVKKKKLKALLPNSKFHDLTISAIYKKQARKNRAKQLFLELLNNYIQK